MNAIKLSCATVSYKAPVIDIKLKGGIKLDAKDVREIIDTSVTLANHKPFVALVDARSKLTLTPKAKSAAAQEKHNPLILANAVLVKKPGVMIAATLFMEHTQPPFRVRVLRDKRTAVKWLKVQAERKGLV